MKRFLPLLLLLWLQCLHAATAHLELQVTLEPATRALQARADLTTDTPQRELSLNPLFKLSRATVNGVDIAVPPQPDASGKLALPRPSATGTPQRVSIEYSGTLPALPQGEQRNSPNPSSLFASTEGSYLSPSGGWYPDPDVPFTYRLSLSLPAGQKGLAPGHQERVIERAGRTIAEYKFEQPAEGVWLMAGPYEVAQQSVLLDGGRSVTVRTWFHPELASLAGGYLQDSVRYIQRYSRTIGDYPFQDFSIVSSPMSHGLGIPSLTYLGRDVLKLPFIRATSLGHEVLHNWWGNGVYPDWTTGNWSEGLTTFMADYAFREDQSEQSAREMRLNWLRDLAAVPAADETSLADFKSRHHGISSVVGYAKAAMVFLMLRDEIGREKFDEGLRLLWRDYRFKTASWKDLQTSFSKAAGRDLSPFFAQWVQRAASPQLALAQDRANTTGRFTLVQRGPVFDMLVPLRLRLASGETRAINVRARERATLVDLAQVPNAVEQRADSKALIRDAVAVELDPQLRLWRRLEPRAVPPIFREVFISPRSELLLAKQDPAWRAPAAALAQRLLDAPPRELSEAGLLAAPEVPALVLGDAASIASLLPRLGISGWPEPLLQPVASGAARSLKGDAQAWTARAPNGKTYAFVMADSPPVLASLQRALPHYGRQSWLVFQEGRVLEQGAWPVQPETLPLARRVQRE